MGGALDSGRGGEPEKYEIPVYGVPVCSYPCSGSGSGSDSKK